MVDALSSGAHSLSPHCHAVAAAALFFDRIKPSEGGRTDKVGARYIHARPLMGGIRCPHLLHTQLHV